MPSGKQEQTEHCADMPRRIRDGVFRAIGLSLSEETCALLSRYYELLTEANRTMNLTRITDPDEAVTKHFADSLALVPMVDINEKKRLLDIGSGAGIPGIVIACAFPEVDITSVDSVGKKIRFQQEAIKELGLSHMTALHARAEDLARDPAFREGFDLVTARAVAPLPVLLEYALPFVRKGGIFAAYKADAAEELDASKRALSDLGGSLREAVSCSVGENSRTILLIEKTKKTPASYPRKAGVPKKTPLL